MSKKTVDGSRFKGIREQEKNGGETLRMVVESCTDPMAIVSSGHYDLVNAAFLDMFGFSEDFPFHGISILEQIASSEQERIKGYLNARRLGLYSAPRYRTKGKRVDGTTFDMEVNVTRYTTPDGRSKSLVALRDITEQKAAEAALRNSERRFRTLFEGTSEGILVADVETRVFRYANPAICRLLGYSVGELCGMSLEDVLPRDRLGELMDEFDAHAREEVSAGMGRPFVTKDGKIVRVDIHSASMEIDGRSCLAGFFTDVTAREQLETEKRLLETQLFQAQKMDSVGRLAGGVAHDINNMLGVISGYAEILMDEIPVEERDNHEAIREILDASVRCQSITRQLLAFARRQPAKPRVIDLNSAVEGMLKMLRRLIGENIELIWHPRAQVWPVNIDPTQVDQILANLCVNARDAISDVGKIFIETDHKVFDSDYCRMHAGVIPGEFVMLSVSDTGCGMEKGVVEKIFEPFFTTKSPGRGTGLGMSTVYGIVKQNEGFINIYSEPGAGTTAKIYFQRYQGALAEDTSSSRGEVPKGRGELLLVVEDEPAALKMVTRMLSDLDYQVLAALSPDQALALARASDQEISLLVTDVIMPGMNGQTLSMELRAIFPRLRSLFMSGYTADIISHHGVMEKEVNFIQKPFSKRTLASRIRESLKGAD